MSVFKEASGPSSADAGPTDNHGVRSRGIGTHRVRVLSWIVAGIGCAGLIFQFLQVEDHTPMLLYFTVWSAILTTIVWPFVDMTTSKVVRIAAQAGALGNVLSGIVYWAVLFPPNGPGRYLLTILANVTLHALLPAAVLVRLHSRPRPETLRAPQELATVIYPLIYLASSFLLDSTFGIPSPYSFLRLHTDTNVWINSVGLLLVWCLLAAALHATTRLWKGNPTKPAG